MSDWDGKAVRESPRAGRWSGREQGRGRATDTKVILKAASRGRHSPSYRASSPVVFSLSFSHSLLSQKKQTSETFAWQQQKHYFFLNRHFFFNERLKGFGHYLKKILRGLPLRILFEQTIVEHLPLTGCLPGIGSRFGHSFGRKCNLTLMLYAALQNFSFNSFHENLNLNIYLSFDISTTLFPPEISSSDWLSLAHPRPSLRGHPGHVSRHN